jgi:LysM repeat protein
LMLPAKKTASTHGHSSQVPDVRRVNEAAASTVDNNTRLVADPEEYRVIRYAVAPGDTITAIARRTCVPEKQLINENNLNDPDSLRPGHMLSLPNNHCLVR